MKRFVSVGAHKRAFPKRKFAEGGAERLDGGGLSRDDPRYKSAVDSYLAQGYPQDEAEEFTQATGPNPVAPYNKMSGNRPLADIAVPETSVTPQTPSSGGAQPLAPETTAAPAATSAKSTSKTTTTTKPSSGTPDWLRALAGAGFGAGTGLGALGGMSAAMLLPLIFKSKKKDTTDTEKAQGGPIELNQGGSMQMRAPRGGRTMRFQDGGLAGITPITNPNPGAALGQMQGRLSAAMAGPPPTSATSGWTPPTAPAGFVPPPPTPDQLAMNNQALNTVPSFLGGRNAGGAPPAMASGMQGGAPPPSFQPIPNPGLGALAAPGMVLAPGTGPGAGIPPSAALAGLRQGLAGTPRPMRGMRPGGVPGPMPGMQPGGVPGPMPGGRALGWPQSFPQGLPPGGTAAGLPPGLFAGAPPATPQTAAQLMLNPANTMAPPPAMATGGSVGETLAKKRRPDRQWGDTEKSAENLPPAPVKKAKGGAMTRKPKGPAKGPKVSIAVVNRRPPVPTPAPDDMQAAPPPPGPPAGLPPGMAQGGKWIQGAIKKPGALHKQLGVPQGEKIPAKKLAAAAGKGGKLGQRARLAQTLKGMKKNRGGECKDKMAAGGVAKVRHGFPNTKKAPPKAFAGGGKVRGCGAATKGCGFSGIF